MANDTNIRAVITAKDEASGVLSKFGDNISGVGERAGSAERSFTQFTKAFVFGNVIFSLGTDIAIKFKDALSEAVKEADIMQASQAQFANTLKVTNDASGQTIKSLNEMADSIAKTTPISRGAALSAEQMLLPFTNIGKDVFPQVLRASTDLATHLNHGLAPSSDMVSAAAKQLGRAFNDPTTGMTLLRRAGISLTATQIEQIKTLQKNGDLLGAQKLLLDDLSKTMGGSAVAAGETWRGKLVEIKNRLIDLQAQGIVKLEQGLQKALPSIEAFVSKMVNMGERVWNYLKPSLEALWDTISTKVMPALENFWHKIIEPLLPVLGTALVAAVWGVTNGLNLLLQAVTPVLNFLANNRWVVEALTGAFIALKASMMLGAAFDAIKIGIVTLQVITFPSMMASIAAVSGAWIAAFPVAGILADIALVAAAIAKVIQTHQLLEQITHDIAANNASNAALIPGMEANALSPDPRVAASARNTLHMLGVAGYAAGTQFAPGGLAVVGEQGPELVNLPRGAQVIPNNKLAQAAGQINITIQAGFFNGTDIEARKYAKQIFSHLKDIANSKNMSLAQMLGV